MKNSFKSILSIWILVLCSVMSVKAQVPDADLLSKGSERYLVVDSAHVFSAAARQQLEQTLVQFDKEQSTQIAVVTIPDLKGYDISQYATDLAHKWGIGQKGKDNGVLILFSLKDKKVHIATGYGAEGALTDGRAGTIIREDMIPFFKQRNYEQGLTNGAIAVMKTLNGEYKNDKGAGDDDFSPGLIVLVIIIIVILIAVFGKKGKGGNNGHNGNNRGGHSSGADFLSGMLLGSLLNGGRGGGFGGGGFGGGSGGGGFGGFGGGGFGGGGASGSWD